MCRENVVSLLLLLKIIVYKVKRISSIQDFMQALLRENGYYMFMLSTVYYSVCISVQLYGFDCMHMPNI